MATADISLRFTSSHTDSEGLGIDGYLPSAVGAALYGTAPKPDFTIPSLGRT